MIKILYIITEVLTGFILKDLTDVKFALDNLVA